MREKGDGNMGKGRCQTVLNEPTAFDWFSSGTKKATLIEHRNWWQKICLLYEEVKIGELRCPNS